MGTLLETMDFTVSAPIAGWLLAITMALAAAWGSMRGWVRRPGPSADPVREAERAVLAASGEVMIVVDDEGRIVAGDEDAGATLPGLERTAPGDLLPDALRRALADPAPQRRRLRVGERALLEVMISERAEGAEAVEGALRGLLLRDASEQLRDRRQLIRLSNFDSLTGLGNRRIFLEQLSRTLEEADEVDRSVALLHVDIDRFKDVNETYGHRAGDALLKALATTIRDVLVTWTDAREGRRGFVSRLSGDEFAIAITGHTAEQEAEALAETLLDRIARPFQTSDQTLSTTASIGLACFPEDGRDVEDLFKASDAALYVAREKGRGRFVRYEAPFSAPAEQARRVESRLRGALERGDLRIHFQPKIELERYTTAGFEALLRWHDEELGIVGPRDFIPIAEESGLIASIGAWCLDETCRQIRQWRDAGYATVPVSVNVSSLQFVDADLQDIVKASLAAHDLEPESLEIELTERLILEDDEGTALTLRDLRSIGVRLALDDFGTGQSALKSLSRHPLDVVKMDRRFLRGLEEDASTAGIAAAVISMAHSLGFEVVAEGVDAQRQADLLREMQCDQIQGFLYSPAVPADRAVEFLAQGEGDRPVVEHGRATSDLDDLLALDAQGGEERTRSGLAAPDAAESAPRPARVLVVDTDAAHLGPFALRLMKLGGDTSMVQDADEASLFLAQENPEIDLLVVSADVDADRISTLRETIAKGSDKPPPLVLAIGENPGDEMRSAMRAASIDWLLGEPAEDHLLRFFLNASRYRSADGAVQRSLRVPVETTVWIRSGGSRRVGTMTSLSARGAGIETDEAYPVGQSLRLEFAIGGSRLRLFGTVVDQGDPDEGDAAAGTAHLGIMFFDLEREDADRIGTILDDAWLRHRP